MKKLLCLFLWVSSLTAFAQLRLPPDIEETTAAADRGDVPGIAAGLAAGVSTEDRNEKGWTPLICAVHANKPDAVRFLLSKGANPNACTRHGSAPVEFAVTDGFDDIVTILLDARADPNGFHTDMAGSDEKWSPLFTALHHHKLAQIAQLLAHGARIDDRSPRGDTALMEACKMPHLDQLQFLIDKGADVHAHTPNGQTALMYAAVNDCDQVARLLLAHRVDANATAVDWPGGPRYDAHQIATERGYPYVLEALAEARDNHAPAAATTALNRQLISALNNGDYERVEAAIANGASVNQPDEDNVLPMTVAALHGDPGVVQLLVKAGADVNLAPDGDPRGSPMALARGQIKSAKTAEEREGFERIIEILGKAGATR